MLVLVLIALSAFAHHSVSANFDREAPQVIRGTVTAYHLRNPHSQIEVDVLGSDGAVAHWLVEWGTRNDLVRRGVDVERIQPGDELTITLIPSRRLEHVGYLRSAILPDGTPIEDRGYRSFRETLTGSAVEERASLDGSWLQLESNRPPVSLTPAGEAAVADYVPLRDDPDLKCTPASLTNVIGIPDPPFEIRLHDEEVEINFEYMDVRRRVPLGPSLSLTEAPYTVADRPHLGRSIGRFQADTLIIETSDLGAGYVDTLGRPYPQSAQMRYEERYTADGDRLSVEITHTDPLFYREPFVMTFEFLRVDLEILDFGCVLEGANYDDRF